MWSLIFCYLLLIVFQLTTPQIPKTPDVIMKSFREDEIVTFHSEMKVSA